MKVVIADSCSLILLAKCNLLEVLAECFTIFVPDAVFNEVVNKGSLEKFPDARVISNLAYEKKINIVKVKGYAQRLPVTMGRGELEAISLAKKTVNSILATDDGKAIKACRYLGLNFIISPKIAVELYRLGKIDFIKTKSSIEKMKIIGRYSSDIIAEAILELEGVRNAKTGYSKSS